VQFLIAIYGGFFGAGIGILMLATMGFMGQSDIHQMNRLKNISAVAINGVAGITFALSGQVRWSLALVMMVSAMAGGYLSAGVAQKIGPVWARRAIVVIGLGIGVYAAPAHFSGRAGQDFVAALSSEGPSCAGPFAPRSGAMALFWKRPEISFFAVRGVKRSIGGDWYHLMLRAPWWFNLLTIACGFLIVNVLFAFAYLRVGGVAGAHGFSDLFFFSVQTMGTIGYGSMYPATFGAHLLTTAEAIAGVFVIALATGLLFSKFSMLRARVRFASSAVISPMNGVSTLMIRIGHERSSQVVDALIRVVFSRSEKTSEGVSMYRMYDLKLERDRIPALSRVDGNARDRRGPLYAAQPRPR
jgi:inward rectifier potassium channel